jgi:NitT/TauT family transport system permease protein
MRLINRHPSRSGGLMLLLLPFIVMAAVYFTGSSMRLKVNPDDKLLPGATQMSDAIKEEAFTEDKRTGEYLLWADTASSLRRLGIGLAVSAVIALAAALATSAFPLVSATFSPFVTVISMIPPLAVLPILFIVFGLDELSKVVLIVVGITPMIIRDLHARGREIPTELWVKAQTLGATSWTLILRLLLPQLLPRLLVAMRLSLCSAWLFLIAAEAIAATDGLGYRIFLVRRYLAMDVILPYVAWITLLAWLIDESLRRLTQWAFPWYGGGAR